MIRTLYQISAGRSNQEAYAGWVTWHAWVKGQVQVGFRRGKPAGKIPFERPRRKRMAGLNMYLQELGGKRRLDSSGSGLGRVARAAVITVMNFLIPYNVIS
jgi:hypothetical protein